MSMRLWILFSLLGFDYATAAFQCMNEKGKAVDWYVLYKLPIMVKSKDYLLRKGLAYMYVTSDNPDGDWTLSSLSINDSKSIPGRTLDPLYHGKSQNMLTALYNDEPPSTSGGSTFGHTKGVVITDTTGGFWLIHSVPKFPLEPISPKTNTKNSYHYPNNAARYGQSFLCITLPANQLNALGTQLMFNKPKIYSSVVPDTVAKKFNNLTDAVKSVYIKKAPWSQKAVLLSSKGMEFTSYAKGSGFNAELYADWVASDIGSELQVETWANGAGELPSNCKSQYHVMDILQLGMKVNNVTLNFKNSQDHSKWAISDDTKTMICIGDINRMAAQLKRGGGTVCFKNPSLWKQYNKAVLDVQPCPA